MAAATDVGRINGLFSSLSPQAWTQEARVGKIKEQQSRSVQIARTTGVGWESSCEPLCATPCSYRQFQLAVPMCCGGVSSEFISGRLQLLGGELSRGLGP